MDNTKRNSLDINEQVWGMTLAEYMQKLGKEMYMSKLNFELRTLQANRNKLINKYKNKTITKKDSDECKATILIIDDILVKKREKIRKIQ